MYHVHVLTVSLLSLTDLILSDQDNFPGSVIKSADTGSFDLPSCSYSWISYTWSLRSHYSCYTLSLTGYQNRRQPRDRRPVLSCSAEVPDAASVVPLVPVHAALVLEQTLLAHAPTVVLDRVRTLPVHLVFLTPLLPLLTTPQGTLLHRTDLSLHSLLFSRQPVDVPPQFDTFPRTQETPGPLSSLQPSTTFCQTQILFRSGQGFSCYHAAL